MMEIKKKTYKDKDKEHFCSGITKKKYTNVHVCSSNKKCQTENIGVPFNFVKLYRSLHRTLWLTRLTETKIIPKSLLCALKNVSHCE